MTDPFSQALAAVSARSLYAPAFVFLAGAASSIGPCVAPRLVAAAGLCAGKTRAQSACILFAIVAGLTAAYAAFGATAALVGAAAKLSTYTYAAVALALGASAVIALWREEHACPQAHAAVSGGGAGGAFLLGASFAFVLSPCCTPLVLGILAYTAGSPNPLYASALLACFALGHALPIACAGLGARAIAQGFAHPTVRRAGTLVGATLMLGLAGYYAVLA